MTASHQLQVDDLRLAYGDRVVIDSLDLLVPPGRVTAIVGANACGKSTLLRALARLLSPRAGHVLLDGASIHRLPAKQVARTLGLLPQSPIAPDGITVADLVGRGRHPHQSLFSRWRAEDDDAVAAALNATETAALADRPVDELSGGQRQRVWLAMALAQQTDLLLLDEPTTFLDVSHQIEVLDLLTDLNRTRGTTVVMVLHDLNLAARYADHLIALAAGRLHAAGDPSDVLTVDTVRAVFGLESVVIADPTSGKPLMLPLGRHHTVGGTAVEATAATGLPDPPAATGLPDPPAATGLSDPPGATGLSDPPGAPDRSDPPGAPDRSDPPGGPGPCIASCGSSGVEDPYGANGATAAGRAPGPDGSSRPPDPRRTR